MDLIFIVGWYMILVVVVVGYATYVIIVIWETFKHANPIFNNLITRSNVGKKTRWQTKPLNQTKPNH